jgi:hypothetical protein
MARFLTFVSRYEITCRVSAYAQTFSLERYFRIAIRENLRPERVPEHFVVATGSLMCNNVCSELMTAMAITKPERTTRRVVSFFTPSQEARLLALAKKHDVTAAEVLRQAFDQFVEAMDSKRKKSA